MMKYKTEAAVFHSQSLKPCLQSVTLDKLRADEVLVEVKACGVCHMDIEAAEIMDLPAVFGHEGAGVVVQVGSAVDHVSPGDRVVMGYGYCGHCPTCSQDQPFFCDASWPLCFGGTREDGSKTMFDANGDSLGAAFFQQSSFARHAITLSRSVVKIDDDVPFEIAAALPCGFLTGAGTALNLLAVDEHSSILIRGVGAVGLGAAAAAKQAGCKKIVASDVLGHRLEFARAFGATDCINAAEIDFDAWRERHYPGGFSSVFNTTAHPEVFRNSVEHLSTGGKLAFAILPSPMEEFSFKPFELFVRCASLHAVSFGSATPADLIPKMLSWWRSGEFDIESIIGLFPLEELASALEASRDGSVLKPVITMS